MKMPSVALTFEGLLAELCDSWLMLALTEDFYKRWFCHCSTCTVVLVWVSGSGVGLWFCFLGAWRTVCFAGMCLGVRCSGVIVSRAQMPLSVSSAPPALGGFPGPRVPCLALSPGTGVQGLPLPLPTPTPPRPFADALLVFCVFPPCVAPAELSSKSVLPRVLCNVPFFPVTILSFSPFLS